MGVQGLIIFRKILMHILKRIVLKKNLRPLHYFYKCSYDHGFLVQLHTKYTIQTIVIIIILRNNTMYFSDLVQFFSLTSMKIAK